MQAARLLASRRPRSADEAWPWCVHVVAAGPDRVGEVSCETDRARFIGRGRRLTRRSRSIADVRCRAASARCSIRSSRCASACESSRAGRRRSRSPPRWRPRVKRRFNSPTAIATSAAADRALSLARTEAEVELRDLDIAPADVALYQELAGALVYPHEALRASADRARERDARAIGALGAGHLRRLADRPGDDPRAGRSAERAAIARGAPVLAHEGHPLRSRDSEREGAFVRAGAPRSTHDHRDGVRRRRRARAPRRRVHSARRPPVAGGCGAAPHRPRAFR